jgi:hypothetical protein
MKAAVAKLQEAHKLVHLAANQPMIQNRCTDRQAAGCVDYPSLCAIRDKLELGPVKLLLGYLTYTPPPRADLGAVRVFSHEPSEQQLQRYASNYVFLADASSKQQPYICYRQYKTRKSFGVTKVALPPALAKLTRDYLAQGERCEWLFTRKHDITRPLTHNNFSKWAAASLRRACAKPVTLTLVRHAYSSHA